METKRRGRQPGQTKDVTIIKDPALEPYHIEVDEVNFTLMKDEKKLGFFTSFAPALKKVAMLKVNSKNKRMTVREYIKEFKETQVALDNLGL